MVAWLVSVVRLVVVAAGGDANSDNQRREARQAGKKHKSVGGPKTERGGAFIAVLFARHAHALPLLEFHLMTEYSSVEEI